jgi:enoyl-CoA hydratase/carnithine racemase
VPCPCRTQSSNADYLLLTGRFIDARRAVALGLINLAVPGEDLDAVIDDTARIIAAKPTLVSS